MQEPKKLSLFTSEMVLSMPLEMPSFINHFVVSSSYIHLLPLMDVSTAKKMQPTKCKEASQMPQRQCNNPTGYFRRFAKDNLLTF